MNNIIQYETEKENSFCFDFLEEKIREGSRKLIESIYEEEVQLFLDRITDEKVVGAFHVVVEPCVDFYASFCASEFRPPEVIKIQAAPRRTDKFSGSFLPSNLFCHTKTCSGREDENRSSGICEC